MPRDLFKPCIGSQLGYVIPLTNWGSWFVFASSLLLVMKLHQRMLFLDKMEMLVPGLHQIVKTWAVQMKYLSGSDEKSLVKERTRSCSTWLSRLHKIMQCHFFALVLHITADYISSHLPLSSDEHAVSQQNISRIEQYWERGGIVVECHTHLNIIC